MIGPEALPVAGIVDHFDEQGLACFGPTAVLLEGVFTADFLARHNIPTASYAVFTEVDAALTYVSSAPIVNKADGLAAGRGHRRKDPR